MIEPKQFLNYLIQNNISFFTGVPDSLLKDFCAYLGDSVDDSQHIIAANEGGAIALATGYYLATGKIGLVYMQNSGFGNATNPLLSLADPEVYGIPILLLIGWRGEPGVHDEPQHVKQGKIQECLLKVMKIPYEIIDDKTQQVGKIVEGLCGTMWKKKCPAAILVRKNTFSNYKISNKVEEVHVLTREDVIKMLLNKLEKGAIVVSTTGKTSREIYEIREELQIGHDRDFLTVGSMGHSSQIALGIALNKPKRNIYCIDGDGAVIMHMGALAIIGAVAKNNFKHIIINNGAHDSVGGQSTVGFNIDFKSLSIACGYQKYLCAENSDELENCIETLKNSTTTVLLEVKVKKGSRDNLGRPKESPQENKNKFMNFLNE